MPESSVTQPSVKPNVGADCWIQKLRHKTPLRFATARFENPGGLVEISQLGNSTFCKPQL